MLPRTPTPCPIEHRSTKFNDHGIQAQELVRRLPILGATGNSTHEPTDIDVGPEVAPIQLSAGYSISGVVGAEWACDCRIAFASL